MINSVFRTGENFYSQGLLEERKYVAKEKKMPEYVTDDLEVSPDSDREDLMKEILMKKILMKILFLMKKKIKYRMCLVFSFEAF